MEKWRKTEKKACHVKAINTKSESHFNEFSVFILPRRMYACKTYQIKEVKYNVGMYQFSFFEIPVSFYFGDAGLILKFKLYVQCTGCNNKLLLCYCDCGTGIVCRQF